jgi:hypothetical protein
MNDQQLDDLKAFLDTRLTQTEVSLRDEMEEMGHRLEEKIEQLSQRMDDGFAGIADIIEHTNGRIDAHDHEIAELKQQAA